LSVEDKGARLGSEGVVAVIVGTTKSALPDTTAFSFTRVALWAVEPTTVQSDDGSLLVDACGPRFLIKVGPIKSIVALPPQPARDNMTFGVEAAAETTVSVDVVDALGNLVKTIPDLRVASGYSAVHVPVTELASGYYLVHFRTPQGTIATHQGLIVR
jgi:hypothetical protein